MLRNGIWLNNTQPKQLQHMDEHQSLIENLEVFLDFVRSEDYKKMVTLAREDEIIREFISDIHLRHNTIVFFENIQEFHPRAIQESHLLAQEICEFLGYE